MTAAAAFLASFLLFTLELVAAKLLLPRFGGAAHVWTSAMMCFQGLLLAGYLYARASLRGRWPLWTHGLVLLLPLLCFPLALAPGGEGGAPVPRLLALLLLAVGAPFFALAASTPVLQGSGEEDYSLYAASNAGALGALLLYPLALEVWLPLDLQLRLWEALYIAAAALQLWCLKGRRAAAAEPEESASARHRSVWVLLALGPSAALLAATNLLSLDFAAVPLLWVLPLALYLLTFILAFSKRAWKPQVKLAAVFGMAAWLGTVLVTVLFSADLPSRWHLIRRLWVVNKFAFYCAALFIVCLICHRALSRARPQGRSADFYVCSALGGWLGALLIGVVMPVLGRRLAMPELDWAAAGGLCFAGLLWRDAVLPEPGRAGPRPGGAALAGLALLGAAGLALYVRQGTAFAPGQLFSLRNFYGYYRVTEEEGGRRFFHGNTLHGLQSLDPAKRRTPMLYFHPHSPLGRVFARFGKEARLVGGLGLGVGVIAAYGRPGQSFVFYELDPDVARVARERFTYLSDSAADCSVVTGDARLALEAGGGPFDVLVVDVFSGGAIPVHLLTREALGLYSRRMARGGVLAFHVTNRFLDLRPVLAALAADGGFHGASAASEPGDLVRGEEYHSVWVVLSRDAAKVKALEKDGWTPLGPALAEPWTDAHAGLLSALKS